MRQRLINALNSTSIQNFLNNYLNFPMLLKGGYEDIFSMFLFLQGFVNNNDIAAQYPLGGRNAADIASLQNGNIVNLIEFGHRFSLQFGNPNTGLEKLISDATHRLQNLTQGADFYTVYLVTDVIQINNIVVQTAWGNYYGNRYGIQNSIANRQNAVQRIQQIMDAINNFNQNNPFNPPLINNIGSLITHNVNNQYGEVDINFIVNGPYSFVQRQQM